MVTSLEDPGEDGLTHYQRLLDARERCDRAYDAARRQVFDAHPPGTIDVEALSATQRAALARLAQAEQDVERLRRAEPRRDA